MQNGGQRNRQGGDMSQCVEICRTCAVTHPQSFLTCGFEAGIVALALRPQGVSPLKTQAFPVNGKSVVCWNGLILGTATVLLAVIPVIVIAGANTGFGLAEGGSGVSAESPPPPSVVLPSFLMARPASQIGLPTDSFSGLFVPRLFNGITASPS